MNLNERIDGGVMKSHHLRSYVNKIQCRLCSIDIPKARIEMGYSICVNCSTEEKKVGHIIYPHKTGAYIQVVDKETHENLNRLDRRGTSKKTAKHYKSFTIEEEQQPKRYKFRRCNKVYTDYETALNMVSEYYDEWGYERALQYLRQLNSSGDISLMTRVKIQDIITDRYLQPTPRSLVRKFNKQIA